MRRAAFTNVYKRHAAQHQSHHRPPSRLRQQHHPGQALLLKGEAGLLAVLRHSDGDRRSNLYAHVTDK